MSFFRILKKKLVYIWNKSIDYKILLSDKLSLLKDSIRKQGANKPNIKSIDETIDKIINEKASMSRYGDGEFKLINNLNIAFQNQEKILSEKLEEILKYEDEKFLVCLPDVFESLNKYSYEPKNYWALHMAKYRTSWNRILKEDKVYYNAFISRCYYMFNDKSKCGQWFDSIKQIWKGRDIVLIEGRQSRLGFGNDLFNNITSLERILVPEENAFSKYNEILKEAKKINKDKLVLLAIGPTATVLAYDLFKVGYQVLDIGHIDIEYEWFLKKATKKIRVKNKYVCEAGNGEDVEDIKDKGYLGQILTEIM